MSSVQEDIQEMLDVCNSRNARDITVNGNWFMATAEDKSMNIEVEWDGNEPTEDDGYSYTVHTMDRFNNDTVTDCSVDYIISEYLSQL